jgi:hypothetical protein
VLQKFAVNVVPNAIDFFKATVLVESMSLAIHFKASDELNKSLSVIIASRVGLTDAQA